MGVNKVDLSTGENLIDLTSDTVAPETMVKGVTAHNSAGEQIEGEFDPNIYQTKEDQTLETESKKVVGAINEVNGKTVDKILEIDTYYGGAEYIEQNPYAGITWEDTTAVYDEDENVIKEVLTYHRAPFLFDEDTMSAEIDNWGILRVSAKGGGDFDKISYIDFWYGLKSNITAYGFDGITWGEEFAFYDENDNAFKLGESYHRIPIMAGANITFEVDEENQVVKINSTGVSKEYVDNLFANIANGDEVAY